MTLLTRKPFPTYIEFVIYEKITIFLGQKHRIYAEK